MPESLVSVWVQNVFNRPGFKYIDMIYDKAEDTRTGMITWRMRAVTYEEKLGQQITKHMLEVLGTNLMYPDAGSSVRKALADGNVFTALHGAIERALTTFQQYQKQVGEMRGGLNPREVLDDISNITIQESQRQPGTWFIDVEVMTAAGSSASAKFSVGLRRQAAPSERG